MVKTGLGAVVRTGAGGRLAGRGQDRPGGGGAHGGGGVPGGRSRLPSSVLGQELERPEIEPVAAAAGAAQPQAQARGAEVTDFGAHFEANRTRFFMVALAFQTVDFANTILEANALASELNRLRLILIAVYAVAFLLAIGTRNRVYHGTVAVAWFLTCVFWGIKALGNPIIVS